MFNFILRFIKWVKIAIAVKKELFTPVNEESKQSNSTVDSVLPDISILKSGQEQEKQQEYFARANSLRDEFFDEGVKVYGEGDFLFKGKDASSMRAVSISEPEYADEVPNDYNPWEDYDRFPKKVVELDPEQLSQFNTTDTKNEDH